MAFKKSKTLKMALIVGSAGVSVMILGFALMSAPVSAFIIIALGLAAPVLYHVALASIITGLFFVASAFGLVLGYSKSQKLLQPRRAKRKARTNQLNHYAKLTREQNSDIAYIKKALNDTYSDKAATINKARRILAKAHQKNGHQFFDKDSRKDHPVIKDYQSCELQEIMVSLLQLMKSYPKLSPYEKNPEEIERLIGEKQEHHEKVISLAVLYLDSLQQQVREVGKEVEFVENTLAN